MEQHLTSQFLQAATHPHEQKTIIWTYCERCMIRNDFVLVRETPLTEIYRCPDCGKELEYTVR